MQSGDNQDAAATAATPPRPASLPSGPVAAPPQVAHPDSRSWWLGAAGVVISAGILTGLVWFGTTMAPAPAAPMVSPSATGDHQVLPTPTPTPPPFAPGPYDGPLTPGEYPWDQLRGGECLQPFETPWAEAFTVVGCETPHTAQMVFTGAFEGGSEALYPGTDALAEQLPLLCGTPDVIDFSAAEDYADVQVEGTYPSTQEQWNAGRRSFYCFLSRAGGETIESSLAAQ